MLRLITCFFCLIAPATMAEVTVFAAASLRGVLEEVNETAPAPVTVSYASSAALARQIAQGAPAEVFVSANTRWVDWLEDQLGADGLATRDILGNELVLIGTADAPDLEINDLPVALGEGFLALGHTRAVPAGIYAQEALTSLDLWDALAGRVIQTDNVRAALRLVALGEAPFAVVYATDALAEPEVRVLHRFAPNSHSPITYRLAQLEKSEEVDAYLDHLNSPEAQDTFRAFGFQEPRGQ
jgi:molybdate transport system substrate-binding protein